jgi:twinkle protein
VNPLDTIKQNTTDHKTNKKEILTGSHQDLPGRNISARTCKLYNYLTGTYQGKLCHIAEYLDSENRVVANHIRLPAKQFRWTGDADTKKLQLFGAHLGSEGTLILTEGEIDAMSVYEALSCNSWRVQGNWKWCVASIASGAGSAEQQITYTTNLDWILGFDKVILFFDADSTGKEAVQKVAQSIGRRVYIAQNFPYKDANEAWQKRDEKAIRTAIENAKAYRPDVIVPASSLWERLLKPDLTRGYSFPWEGWNLLTKGLQPGELWMLSGGTGIGKSLFSRSICLHLARQGVTCAYIGLEETVDTTLARMMSEEVGKKVYLMGEAERAEIQDELMRAFMPIEEHIYFMDRFGGDNFESFVNNVRHYVLVEGCKVVFLDHFSLLADGIALGTDQRRAIDKCIKELKTMCIELKFTMVCVCHLSRDSGGHTPAEEGGEPHLGQLRGSHSLAQIPDYIVMFQRNPNDNNPDSANTTTCYLKKNRVTGELGEMCQLYYNRETCQFKPTYDFR